MTTEKLEHTCDGGKLAPCLACDIRLLFDSLGPFRVQDDALKRLESALAKRLAESTRAPVGELEHLEQGCSEAFVWLQWHERQGTELAKHQVEWLRAHERYMASKVEESARGK